MQRNFIKIMLALVISLTCSCGSKSSSDDAASSTTALEGVWKTGCLVLTGTDNSKTYFGVILTYSGNTYKTDTIYYGDSTCSINTDSLSEKGTFVISGDYTPISGASKVDNTCTGVTRRFETAALIKIANSISAYGYTDWVVGVDKDVAGKKETSSATSTRSAVGEVEYDIFKITDKTIKTGDSATGTGKTADTRTTVCIAATKQACALSNR